MGSSKLGIRTASVLSAFGLALSLAACGPAGTQPDAADQQSDVTANSAAPETLDEWELAFGDCMRDEGIDVADLADPDLELSGPEADQVAAAAERCQEKVGELPISEADQEQIDREFQELGKEIAQCYRDHGYDVVDPKRIEELSLPEVVPDEVAQECDKGIVSRTEAG